LSKAVFRQGPSGLETKFEELVEKILGFFLVFGFLVLAPHGLGWRAGIGTKNLDEKDFNYVLLDK
jgi:hypothetical protein